MSIYTTDGSWLKDMKLNLLEGFHMCLFVSRSGKVRLRDLDKAVKHRDYCMYYVDALTLEHNVLPTQYVYLSRDSQNKHR